jgi:hypothetical protein
MGGEGIGYPGVAFRMEQATAVAVQYKIAIDQGNAPHAWVLGGEVAMRDGLSTRSSWGELTARYGKAVTDATSGLVFAAFCGMPRLLFRLNPPAEWWALRDETMPIPDGSIVEEVTVLSPEQHRLQRSVSTLRC